MFFKVGDKVKFLNDTGEGVVTEITDRKLAKVQTTDGFEIPVLMDELVSASDNPDYSGENKYTEPELSIQTDHEKVQISETTQEEYDDQSLERFSGSVVLGLVPEDPDHIHNTDVDLYLINDSNYFIQYIIGSAENEVFNLTAKGELEPDTKLFIKTFNQADLSKLSLISLQAIIFRKGKYYKANPIDVKLYTGDIKFYKESFYKENEYFDEKAILSISGQEEEYRKKLSGITDSEIQKAVIEKETTEEPKYRKVEKPVEEVTEVDLHIHEIMDNYNHLTNSEIVEIQLARFETSLETALLSNAGKIVFIHGVGNGKLKYELRKKLDNKYPKLQYQDASFREYGFGATLVYLKR